VESLTPLKNPSLGRRPGTLVVSGVLVLALGSSGCLGDRAGAGLAEDSPEVQADGIPADGGSDAGTSPPTYLAAPPSDIPMAELGYTVGEATAPLRVVEFSDFGCGYCRQFHLEVYPTIEREYVATGKVQWKYVPMILGFFGPTAEIAAHAGECAIEQGGGFPLMRDRIFQEQSEWKRASDPVALLEGYARDAGLDVPRWTRCVQEERRGARIASGTTLGLRSGVRGTPTFFIIGHGTVPGALPLDLFRQILDGALASEAEP